MMNVSQLLYILKQMPPYYDVIVSDYDCREIEIILDELFERVNINGYDSNDDFNQPINIELSSELKEKLEDEHKHRVYHYENRNEFFDVKMSDSEIIFTTRNVAQPFCTIYSKYNEFAYSPFDENDLKEIEEELEKVFIKAFEKKFK